MSGFCILTAHDYLSTHCSFIINAFRSKLLNNKNNRIALTESINRETKLCTDLGYERVETFAVCSCYIRNSVSCQFRCLSLII